MESDETWSTAFVQVGPGFYEVLPDYWGRVDSPAVRGLTPVSQRESRLIAGDLNAYPFLDGGVVMCEQVNPEFWSDDVVDDGIWVVGSSALRAVCDVLGIVQPERLDGESAVPSVAEVRLAIQDGRLLLGDWKVQADAITFKSKIAELAHQAVGWLGSGQP